MPCTCPRDPETGRVIPRSDCPMTLHIEALWDQIEAEEMGVVL